MSDDVFPFNLPDREFRQYAQQLKRDNHRHPDELFRLLPSEHASQTERSGGRLVEVWRSKYFLVQVYRPEDGYQRVSVCRAEIDTTNRRWRDGLTWEDLMRVKREIGRGESEAVEAYPADSDIVNVANFRHLILCEVPLPFFWRKK
jgi:hypothetical protein